jgi:hypothetical protein
MLVYLIFLTYIGHGYSAFSGLYVLYGHFISTNTAGGDNYLITQQTDNNTIDYT